MRTVYISFCCIYTVAVFSIGQQSTFILNEQDGEATVCVQLISSVLLDRDISLELLPAADGTASRTDFDGSPLTYTFLPGNSTGYFVCNTIGIAQDGILENIEEFTIQLMSNPEVEDVNIVQASATISIADSDGKQNSYYRGRSRNQKRVILMNT